MATKIYHMESKYNPNTLEMIYEMHKEGMPVGRIANFLGADVRRIDDILKHAKIKFQNDIKSRKKNNSRNTVLQKSTIVRPAAVYSNKQHV